METTIKIIEMTKEDFSVDELKIVGARTSDEAKEAASEWCEEHNCILNELQDAKEEFKPNEDGQVVYYAKVCSDDYD